MRTSPLLPLAITLTLSGCSTGTTYGLWVMTLGTPATTGTSSCDENYDRARCLDNATDGNNKWTIEDNAQVSEELQFVEVLKGTGDGAFLVAGGKVYPGTVDKDAFTFEWKSTTKSLHSEDFEGDYEYITDENSVINTKFAFTLGKDAGTLSGKLTQTVTSTFNVKETDQPNNDEVLGYVGQIDDDATRFLENTNDIGEPDGRYNSPDLEECQATNCEIAVVENTTTNWDLSGDFASDQSIGQIGDYQDVVQTPGADLGDILD
jgi:hypothetical protein